MHGVNALAAPRRRLGYQLGVCCHECARLIPQRWQRLPRLADRQREAVLDAPAPCRRPFQGMPLVCRQIDTVVASAAAQTQRPTGTLPLRSGLMSRDVCRE